MRHRNLAPEDASRHVHKVRTLLATSDGTLSKVRTIGGSVYLDDAVEDPENPQLAFAAAISSVGAFDLLAPLETGDQLMRVWGPNLVRPSKGTRISPWVLAGEPCIRNSRIPTATLYALSYEGGLLPTDIARLYGDLSEVAVVEAIDLEEKMRSREPVSS